MRKIGLAVAMVLAFGNGAAAQSWAPWNQQHSYAGPKQQREAANLDALEKPAAKQGPAFLDGGPRPDISPLPPPVVSIQTGQSPGTIVIDQAARKLYLTQSANSALVYPISVGREGFRWTGREKISRVAVWPDWRPPVEMRERQPQLPELMSGGLNNPLGAKALYLGNSLYRIHGSNTKTVGSASSSGCFRMQNNHVVDLASRVGIGTTVVVKDKL